MSATILSNASITQARKRWQPGIGPAIAVRPLHALLFCLPLLAVSPCAHASEVDITQISLEQLLDISIIGASKYAQKQSDVAAAVNVITREEIKAFGWRNLNDALATLPGIHTTYDRQYSYLGTRGFGLPGDYNTRVLLTINGNRVNDTVYDAALMGRSLPLNMDLIERIEYIPGPGGAVYGQNALFGVINVVTRKGADVNGVEVAAAYENPKAARQGRASWGKTLDNGLDVLLSVSSYKAKGEDRFLDFPGATPASGMATNLDGEQDQEFFARLARDAWSFDFVYGDRSKDDPTASFGGDPLVAGQYQRDSYVLAQLQYQEWLAGDTLQLTGRAFMGRQRYTSLYSYGEPFYSTGTSNWHGLELRLLSTAWSNHKVMWGMDAQVNTRQDQTGTYIENPSSANNTVILGAGWRAGVYVQDEWTLNDQVKTTLGLRVDRDNVTGTKLSPRAALIWKATSDTTLKALYGRAHRSPNKYERDYDDGVTQVTNPGLDGEQVDTLELVLDRRLRQNFFVRGSVYQWTMKDLVTLQDVGGGLFQYQSGEKVEARGVELSADKTWDRGVRLRGSLSYQDVAYVSGADLDNAPTLLGKLNVSGPLLSTGLRFGYELQYSSSRQAIDGSDLAGYWLSNLHLSTDKWMKGLDVSLGIYNVFDTQYVHPGSDINWQNALEQDGRSARLKFTYAF